MNALPSISIVVPSYNQGRYIRETLQSLVDQDYPNLEVIIQDGGSTDDSVEIAREFVRLHPAVFQLFVEKDAGQADAINRGFARTTGSILAFLNSDDTYVSGALKRVSEEIDPARGRHVVVGRSIFTGENSRYVGVEHPAEYRSHFEHLAIWKRGFNTIPQPSVFWHRTVAERVGELDVNEHHALDYDLFCRMSRTYPFHVVDALLSTYRMHDESKSSQRSEAEVLALSIGVSRKHWGPWWSPLRWRLAASHWIYSKNFHDHARHHARRAEQAFRERRLSAAAAGFLATALYSPRMARDRLLYGWLSARVPSLMRRVVDVQSGFHGLHADGWIGPTYTAVVDVPDDATRLICALEFVPQQGHAGFGVTLKLNGDVVSRALAEVPGALSLEADVQPLRGRRATLQVDSAHSFIPREIMDVDDSRELSLKYHGISFT